MWVSASLSESALLRPYLEAGARTRAESRTSRSKTSDKRIFSKRISYILFCNSPLGEGQSYEPRVRRSFGTQGEIPGTIFKQYHSSMSSKTAAKLRRRLHDDVATGNLSSLRDTLHSLYEDDTSPLGSQSEIATPAAFAALVEIGCLAQAHAAASPTDRIRAHIADEMQQNVERLRKGFHVDRDTMECVRAAMDACVTSDTLDKAHHETIQALKDTQLDERVKVLRHTVSWAPNKRGGRATSPPPRRFDDLETVRPDDAL